LHEEQEKKIKQEETLIEEVNELEKEIGKAYVKFPFDFVMGERVRGFQSLIQNLVQVIAEKLEELEEF
jgi:predicted metalloendopeptidase